jgi:hypothetical protein
MMDTLISLFHYECISKLHIIHHEQVNQNHYFKNLSKNSVLTNIWFVYINQL